MEDREIVDWFFERSEQAIIGLSETYGGVLVRFALRFTGNREDAEECVNDAFLAVWNTVPPERPRELFAYVCRIVRNLAVKKYHENTAQKRGPVYTEALDELSECFPDPACPEDTLDKEEYSALLDGFLKTLDRDTRVLFMRRYWYSESVPSLARLFCVSEHTVSVRLWRVREKLKAYFQKKGIVL